MEKIALRALMISFTAGAFSDASSGGPADMVSRSGSDNPAVLETATFAGGCFWCMEPPFEKLEGVRDVISGYAGGNKKDPTYKEVSQGGTGHAEAIQIVYDPSKVTY